MLDDVVKRLRRLISEGDPLSREFAVWLDVHREDQPLGESAGGLWRPREVALAAVQTASGRPAVRPFRDGLTSLRGRQYFVPHAAGVFEADPLAVLCVAIGIRHQEDRESAEWLAAIAARAMQGESDPWRISLLSATAVVLSEEAPRPIPPELTVALSTKGFGSFDSVIAEKALKASLALDDPPPDQAAVRLASLQACIAASSNQASPVTNPSPHPLRSAIMHDKIKILFIGANPNSTPRIGINEEQRDIQNRIRESQLREAIEMAVAVAARPDDLELALLEHKPIVVHFSGHGLGALGLTFQGDNVNDTKAMSADALQHLFKILKKNVRVVVLNACHSDQQAKAIAKEIDFVVGINALKREGLKDDEGVPVLRVRTGVSEDVGLLAPNS